MNIDQELITVFLAESRELIEEVEPQILRLAELGGENGAAQSDIINNIFRLFHSIKGSAGMMNLPQIAGVSHEAETLLDVFRSEKATITPAHIDLLLQTIDVVRSFLNHLEATGSDRDADLHQEDLINSLKQAVAAFATAASTSTGEGQGLQESRGKALEHAGQSPGFLPKGDLQGLVAKLATGWDFYLLEGNEGRYPDAEAIMTFLMALDSIKSSLHDLRLGGSGTIADLAAIEPLLAELDLQLGRLADESTPRLGEILLEQGDVAPEHLEQALDRQKPAPLGEILINMGATSPERVETALEKQARQKAAHLSGGVPEGTENIRVSLNKLDTLVNLVGELVIAESMVTRNPDLEGLELENFEKSVHLLRRITSDLQSIALNIRMVPLTATFQKLKRAVHDLARKQQKRVKLLIGGETTEVDKTMAERISDPLLHMIRNSIDNGLESPEERKSVGKPDEGVITLEARSEGGEIWIVVSDDGRGLNREKILAKAIRQGLVDPHSQQLSEDDIHQLVFAPGFSTSETVTEISGRGVGMDVVKRNIESLKGRLSVASKPGAGTTFFLQIPLTMAIIEGMLVRVGHSRYTIPLLAIRESISPTAESISPMPSGEEYVKIRNELYPILRLHRIFQIDTDQRSLEDSILVVVEEHGERFCLMVDEILGQNQTVVKGLSPYLEGTEGLSGCTILGNGQVSLILDIPFLSKMVKTSKRRSEGGRTNE